MSKIEIFSRHCLFSKISQHKERPSGFSREKCFRNFLSTVDRAEANITFFIDVAAASIDHSHFLFENCEDPIIRTVAGSEALAFLHLLDHISSRAFSPDTIIYIVEDDYLHRPGWLTILREGFSLPIDYVTLYDHRDKYFLSMYRKLSSRLYITPSCHWRTTPSTTNTFATRFGTLLDDLKIHRRFSQNRLISDDHRKFCRLAHKWKSRVVISPLPGWSTHADPQFASPFIDWEFLLQTEKEEKVCRH